MKKTLTFTTQVFKEGKQYVSFNPELEVASCGDTPREAKESLQKAIRAFLRAAKEKGTLDGILEEAGYIRTKDAWRDPAHVTVERILVAV